MNKNFLLSPIKEKNKIINLLKSEYMKLEAPEYIYLLNEKADKEN